MRDGEGGGEGGREGGAGVIPCVLAERQSEMPARSKAAIPCVLADPDLKPMR